MRFIDRLRELLLPALALTILATLWTLAKARNAEQDLARGFPPAPQALMDKIARAAAEDAPVDLTAKADATPADAH